MADLSDVFSTEGLPELTKNTKLKEKDLLTSSAGVTASQSFPIKSDDVTFSIGLSADMRVQLFNDVDDKDDAKLVNVEDAFISFKPSTEALLKYSYLVKAKANGSGSLSDVGFEFDGEQKIESGIYSQHNNNDSIRGSVIGDISKFPTIFLFKDVDKLPEGKSVYYLTRGKLSAGIKVSWSDVMSKSLNEITDLLPGDLSLDVKIGTSLAASFAVSLTDDFIYAIKKSGAKFQICIRKATSSDLSGKIGASIGVEFMDPDSVEEQLNEVVDKVIEGATGKSKEILNKLIEDVSDGNVSSDDLENFNEIIARLDLEGIDDQVEALKEKLNDLEGKVRDIVETIAKANVKLSFGYEYQRIASNKEFLKAEFTKARLKEYHNDFLKFKLKDFIGKMTDGSISGVKVDEYLREKSISTKKSWGLGFSFGGRTIFSGKDFEDIDETKRYNIKGKQQVVIDITKGYKSKWSGTDIRWIANLGAEMSAFSSGDVPRMREFDYSMYVNMFYNLKVTSQNKLREFLDLGVLWGAVSQNEVERIIDKHYTAIKAAGKATLEAKVILPHEVMQVLIQQVAHNDLNDLNVKYWSQSFAAAMSYWDDFEVRSKVGVRQDTYAPLWLMYFKNPKLSGKAYAREAKKHLKKVQGNNGLSNGELMNWNKSSASFFSSTLYMNGNTFNSTKNFMSGMKALSNQINNNTAYDKEFVNAYKKMKQFFSQSHQVRALGSFLLKYVDGNPILKGDVERIFTITYGEGDDQEVINIATS